MERVVITGMGVISSVGSTVDSFWENIKSGKHGFSKIDCFDTTNHKVKVAAQVRDFDAEQFIDKKDARRMDRFCKFALAASKMAIRDSGTDFSYIDPFRVGVIIGSGIGGFYSFEEEHTKFVQRGEKGPARTSALLIPAIIPNMAAGYVSIAHQFKGICYAPVSACASSTHAIGEAFRNIKHGYLDAAVAGGAEATITTFAISAFANMTALYTGDDINRASIPFDAQRSGFVMGEGAGIVILESLSSAQKRGAKIYAEIVGYGATGDAYHITSPDPEGRGASKAMEFALAEANLTLQDITYINAHGTSTPLNDKYETGAIKNTFGEYAKKIPVTSTKSMTGHLLGAAGGVEAIISALAVRDDIVPPTVGYKIPDPDCDLDYVTDGAKSLKMIAALSNSLGFGGHNASICIKKYID
jgi:3-oxoacyl-[acyl-carrier-protein] synthase II